MLSLLLSSRGSTGPAPELLLSSLLSKLPRRGRESAVVVLLLLLGLQQEKQGPQAEIIIVIMVVRCNTVGLIVHYILVKL
jgi:hypothetical protein